MVYGVARGPPVDEGDLAAFVEAITTLRVDEWQARIAALRRLVYATPDYGTSPLTAEEVVQMTPSSQPPHRGAPRNKDHTIPWYRSSKSVRRLAMPLKSLLLDARSAVVKEATELIGTLMIVKLQPRPSLAADEGGDDGRGGGDGGGLETIHGGSRRPRPPPPAAFVGRLLLKDLLPAILDLSKQTVKAIRTYGIGMMLDVLPHCRVKSCLVVLLERMKTHQNRTLREDCARFLRCVLETWPWDPAGGGDAVASSDVGIVNSRKEERLSLDSTRQIGLGLGRTLSDSAKPVREEAKRGFLVLFRRFRPLWNEVLSSGVVRDVRLRKKLMEAASRADGTLFDDASLGEYSTNSAVSGLSYASYRSTATHRSYASRGVRGTPPPPGAVGHAVPTVIGTPKVSPRLRPGVQRTPSSSSPGYLRSTGSSVARVSETMQAKGSSTKHSIHEYVASTGHVASTPSPPGGKDTLYGGRGNGVATPQQPFASLLQTPGQFTMRPSPDARPESTVLRKRLSRRISGIVDDGPGPASTPVPLCSIDETEGSDNGIPTTVNDGNAADIAGVALEVVTAHLSHIEEIEGLLSQEKDLLLDLNRQLGIDITDETETGELTTRLASLLEEQVCDYFEAVHVCVDKQRNAGETLLKEMERISLGDVSCLGGGDSSDHSPEQGRDLAQSPGVQRNLFVAAAARS